MLTIICPRQTLSLVTQEEGAVEAIEVEDAAVGRGRGRGGHSHIRDWAAEAEDGEGDVFEEFDEDGFPIDAMDPTI